MVLFGIWSILVAMKRIINERGGNLGDSMHEEIAAVYKGSNDEETFTAAFMSSTSSVFLLPTQR